MLVLVGRGVDSVADALDDHVAERDVDALADRPLAPSAAAGRPGKDPSAVTVQDEVAAILKDQRAVHSVLAAPSELHGRSVRNAVQE